MRATILAAPAGRQGAFMNRIGPLLLASLLAAAHADVVAQAAQPATLIASQTEAMRVFAMLDGAWRGPATILQGDGSS
jgi:hypothetical protein